MIIAIPEVLREVLGPDGARELAELLNKASVQTRGDVIEVAAGRFERRLAEEIGGLRAEIAGLRGYIDAKIAELRGDLESQIAGLRGDLESQIAELRGDLESQIAELRGDLQSQIGDLRGGLRAEFAADFRALEARIGAIEARVTRWMFVFWVGQVGMLAAIIVALFRA